MRIYTKPQTNDKAMPISIEDAKMYTENRHTIETIKKESEATIPDIQKIASAQNPDGVTLQQLEDLEALYAAQMQRIGEIDRNSIANDTNDTRMAIYKNISNGLYYIRYRILLWKTIEDGSADVSQYLDRLQDINTMKCSVPPVLFGSIDTAMINRTTNDTIKTTRSRIMELTEQHTADEKRDPEGADGQGGETPSLPPSSIHTPVDDAMNNGNFIDTRDCIINVATYKLSQPSGSDDDNPESTFDEFVSMYQYLCSRYAPPDTQADNTQWLAKAIEFIGRQNPQLKERTKDLLHEINTNGPAPPTKKQRVD